MHNIYKIAESKHIGGNGRYTILYRYTDIQIIDTQINEFVLQFLDFQCHANVALRMEAHSAHETVSISR